MNKEQAEKLILYIESAIAEAISSTNNWSNDRKYHIPTDVARQLFLESVVK